MPEFASFIVSCVSATISLTALWFSALHHGSLKMTRPSLIAFARGDGPVAEAPKIFLRTLLYSTGRRGHALESLFIRARQGSTVQTFLFWGYGEGDGLEAGSGLFVGPEGHVAYHHFLLTADANGFRFQPGTITLELYGTIAGRSHAALLHTVDLPLPEDAANALRDDPDTGVFFAWDPDARNYRCHSEKRPSIPRSTSVSRSGAGRFRGE